MQIKTFTAKSTKAVLAMIKQELGPDAVILDTEESNGTITMTAALERASTPFVAPSPPSFDGLSGDFADSLVGGMPGGYDKGFGNGYADGFTKAPAPKYTRSGADGYESGASVAQGVFASLQGEAGRWGDFGDPARNEVFSRSGERPFTPPSGRAEEQGEREEANGNAEPLYSPKGRLRKAADPSEHAATEHAGGRARGRERAREDYAPGAPDSHGGSGAPVPPAPSQATRSGRTQTARSTAPAHAKEQASPQHFAAPPEGWRQWQDEWNSIKNHILALMKPALRLDRLPPRQRLAIEFLQREGVNDGAVLHLFRELSENPESSILQPLGGMVPVKPWGEHTWPEKIQLVAGPFGAGKTTVSIRLALALRRMAPTMRICLVNADATRGNGRLLLRHYCDLSDFSYKEAANTLELVGALSEALRDGFDKVLVDLPGLSRGRFLASLVADAGLANMAAGRENDVAVHLALDPHFGDLQMQGIIDRYRTPLRGSLVWTKLDEAGHFGQLVNMGMASGLPVSALSFGPGLGNSLVPAEANMLWRLLFKRELPSG